MNYETSEKLYTELNPKNFERLKQFVYDECGIKLPPAKKTMLEVRLRKRLKAHGLTSFNDYCDFLFETLGTNDEKVKMIDLVTTNKTDFYREPKHYDFMNGVVLPHFLKLQPRKTLNLWSAACSTGEEPFTLAIELKEFQERNKEFSFSIIATDISTEVLSKANSAIYAGERILPVRSELKRKYFMRSKDPLKDVYRVVPELRKTVTFGRFNFMEKNWNINQKFEIIFCRNVLIYFDKATQEKVVAKLCDQLITGGFLFLGHSETVLNMNLPLVQVASSVYQKIK